MRHRTIAAFLLLAGCYGTSISAKDYDQSCTTDADCTVVSDGEVCGACGPCPNAAVNAKVAAQFNLDKTAIACVRIGPGVACGACFLPMAACLSGTCSVTR